MAVGDALNRTAGLDVGDKRKLLNNKEIKGIVKEYAESVIHGARKESGIIDVFDCVDNINREDHIINNLPFGKIQKLINMTMKYLYIGYYNNPAIVDNFSVCDTPMDNIIATFVYESYRIILNENGSSCSRDTKSKFKKTGWSSIDDTNEYTAFQECVDFIIKEKQLNCNRICFDYIFWNKAKRCIYTEDGNEYNKEQLVNNIKKIWEDYTQQGQPL